MKDDLGRDWAGNFSRQRFIESRVMREAKLGREHPVDVAGALGTIIANMIADVAVDLESALKGLEATKEDMAQSIRERFETVTKQ